MFKVTPIGSCRITSPLRHGQSNYGIQLNLGRCYGYCHSPAEAVQMARFMMGRSTLTEETWPLVSRSHDLAQISAADHETSDLYVVELASAKEISVDGVLVQLNYLNSVYAHFFSDTGRASEFWTCAEQRDTTSLTDFLLREWSGTELQRIQSETLGKIRLRFVTRETLRRNIARLSSLLPDVLFVSHVDARKTDGESIRSRSAFIRMVSEEVRAAGCKFYNPTDLMHEFGQSAAIEDESTGLAHFTKTFSDAVMDDWMRRYIAPRTDADVLHDDEGALVHRLQPQIAAAVHGGRIADAQSRLYALSRQTGAVSRLLHQVNQIAQMAQDDFFTGEMPTAGAVLSLEERSRLVQDACALGLYDTALDIAAQAEGGIKSLPSHTLLRVGDGAIAAGDMDNAFEFFLAAVSRNLELDRAKTTLAQLAIGEGIDLLGELTPENAERFLNHLGPVERLELLQLNGQPFTAAITEDTTAPEMADIAAHLAARQGLEDGAEAIAFWREQKQTDRASHPALAALLDTWLAAASDLEIGAERTQTIRWILFAAPRHQPAREAMRDIRQDLAQRVRAAGKDGDIATLDAMAEEVDALGTGFPEYDLWRARLRYGLGDYTEAMDLGEAAAVHLPEKINLWVLLMRAAKKAEETSKAAQFARKVVELSCAETEKLKAEAENLLQSHLVGA